MKLSPSLLSLTAFALLATTPLSPSEALAMRLKACTKADGKVVVKRRCRTARGETQLDLATVSQQAVGPQGATGPQGSAGPIGPQGIQGEPGLPGILSTVVRRTTITTNSTFIDRSVSCEPGEVALGGGALVGGSVSNIRMISNAPAFVAEGEPATAWRAIWQNANSNTSNFNVYVVCAVLN